MKIVYVCKEEFKDKVEEIHFVNDADYEELSGFTVLSLLYYKNDRIYPLYDFPLEEEEPDYINHKTEYLAMDELVAGGLADFDNFVFYCTDTKFDPNKKQKSDIMSYFNKFITRFIRSSRNAENGAPSAV